jgi:uncharacterized Fe-S cluster protein YjdI
VRKPAFFYLDFEKHEKNHIFTENTTIMVMGEMDNVQREYTNGEITVKWRPHLCDHSAVCLIKLPKVFDNTKRPWLNMQGASTNEIIDTAALTFKYNKDILKKEEGEIVPKTEILIVDGGPARISGDFIMKDEAGNVICKETKISLCRCGKSGKLPFCDGSHR